MYPVFPLHRLVYYSTDLQSCHWPNRSQPNGLEKLAQQIPTNLMHPMRRNPLPTLLFYPVPIISLAPVGLLFQRPPKLSLTKQKSAKRFRKIGATDSSQFDAPTAKKSSAKQFSKKHTFEGFHLKCSNISSLCWFFFYRSTKLYVYFLNFLVWANFINAFWRYFLPMLLW